MTGARKVKASRPGLPEYARRVMAVRQQRGWTQKQLAIELDVRANTISNWERGVSGPRPAEEKLLKLLLTGHNSRSFGVTDEDCNGLISSC